MRWAKLTLANFAMNGLCRSLLETVGLSFKNMANLLSGLIFIYLIKKGDICAVQTIQDIINNYFAE